MLRTLTLTVIVSLSLCLCHNQDYLHSLGKARTAQVQKDARIGEAQYKRDAVIRVKKKDLHHYATNLYLLIK